MSSKDFHSFVCHFASVCIGEYKCACVCLCASVCICTCLCVCICVNADVCICVWRTKVNIRWLSQSMLDLLRQSQPQNLEFLDLPELASKPHRSSCFLLPSAGIIVTYLHT